jgi:hypothetical protein
MSQPTLPPPRNTVVIVIIVMALVALLFGKQIKAAIQKSRMKRADATEDTSTDPPPSSNGPTGTGSGGTGQPKKTTPPQQVPSKDNPAPPKPIPIPPAACNCKTGWFGDKSYLGNANVSRAVRNNNPCNIKRNNTDWKCKVPQKEVIGEELYEQFYCWKYGVRAAIKQVQTLIKGGQNTILKLVQSWDSRVANDTDYVAFLSSRLKKKSDEVLLANDKNTIYLLVSGIAMKENYDRFTSARYTNVISQSEFNTAWAIL